MKSRLVLALFVLSQYILYSQPSIIILESPLSGTIDTAAMDAVVMNPGFIYSSVGNTFYAHIADNSSPIFYDSGEEIPDADTRILDKTLVLGAISGAHSVGAAGSAHYSIPVALPSGTGGMTPSISIVYNSQGGNGILGYGWNLSGIGSISRSGRNVFYDSLTSAVKFDYNDRFDLNGERLLLFSGTYGYNNSEYRTVSSQTSRIKSYGTIGNGPEYFTEETKSGLTIEYGNSPDSRIDYSGSNSTIAGWLVNKVTDKSGNYMTYHYENSEGEYYIRSIKYTGNSSIQTPYDSVVFRYVDRTCDSVKLYRAGESIVRKKLLRNITVYSEGSEIRNFDFSYLRTFYTYLVEINERNRIGERCNPTIIKWGAKGAFTSNENISLNTQYDEQLSAIGDYNLDGKEDFVTWAETPSGGTRWGLYINNGSGSYTLTDYENSDDPSSFRSYETGFSPYTYTFSSNDDFNGDGRPDVLMRAGDTILCYTAVDNNQLVFNQLDTCSIVGLSKIFPGDFDGNGTAEVLLVGSSSAVIHSFRLDQTWTVSLPGNNIILSDVNGDSKTDLVLLSSSGHSVYEFIYDSGTNSYSLIQLSQDPYQVLSITKSLEGDFNGDGYPDFLVKGSTGWYIANSNGLKFVQSAIPVPLSAQFDPFTYPDDKGIYVRDLNNDYKSDIIAASTVYKNTTVVDSVRLEIYLSTGNSFQKLYYSISYSEKAAQGSLLFGDFKGDASTDILLYMSKVIQTGGLHKSNFVKTIADGLNNKTAFSFVKTVVPDASQTRPLLYRPLVYSTAELFVIDTLSVISGTDVISRTKYSFANPVIHLTGKGLLGFANTYSKNLLTGMYSRSSSGINQDKVFLYESRASVFNNQNTEISAIKTTPTVRTFNWGGYTLSQMSVISQDLLKSTADTGYVSLDDYGNPLIKTESYNGQGFITVEKSYTDEGSWCPARVTSAVVTKRKSGSSGEFSQESGYEYNSLGQLVKERHYINTPDSLVTTFEYNAFGKVTKKTIYPKESYPRSEVYTYDQKNRVPLTIVNGALQVTRTYDFQLGRMLTETNPGGITTSNTYDDNGRLVKNSLTVDQYIENSYYWNNDPSVDALMVLETRVNGGNITKVWTDGLGRVKKESTKGFNGEDVFSDKIYNQKGEIINTSQPYFDGDTPLWNTFSYDINGRPSSTVVNGVTDNISYNDLSVTVTRACSGFNKTFSRTYNGLGQTVSASQNGLDIYFSYADNGSVDTITPPGTGTRVTYAYDSRGLPVNEADPDRGINQAGYNSLGQKALSINAAGDQSVAWYDYYGRDSLWVKPDGNTTFTYLTSGAAKGSVYHITSPVETREYRYDSMGRITRTCDSINDTEKMAFAYEYDIYGRISRLTYPTGFSVTYHYNSQGYLYQVKNGSTNAVIWQGLTTDARGNMTSYSLSENNINVTRAYNTAGFISEIKTTVGGNTRQWFEYQFDTPTGNMTWRKDRIRSLTEDFTYDIHDRLTIAKGTGRDSLVMTYDDIGNMLSKSDVGTYSYNSERVHAVENVDPSADTTMFGNQRIEYNYMNLPEYIATDNDSLVYTYGIGTQRIKAALYNGNGQLVRTTWYGNGFERVVEGATEKFYHWIQSPAGTVALVVKVTGGSTTTYYLCGDNLGSLTGIMDSTGTMTGEYSYDAWGRRRSPSDWSYNVTDPGITFRGYTGHEHLDAFGLIHMNGRIYDPHLARVLNPDPVIQDMENIQAYNRYSYCLNNPLKYIDPSGYTYRDNGTTKNSGVLDEWYEMERIEAFERFLSRYAGSGIHHGGGGSGGGYGMPGRSYANGTNGDGSNGYYYDNLTGTYRDTETGEEVPYWIATNGVRFNSGSNYTGSSRSGAFRIDHDNSDGFSIMYSGNDLDFWYYAWDGEKSYFSSSEGFSDGRETNIWNYISDVASLASMDPTIRGTWAFNSSGGDVRWVGKKGIVYKLSQVKNNGGYVKSMNYAKNASRLTRGLGSGLTYISIGATTVNTVSAFANGTDNTSTITNAVIGIGGGVLTLVGAPVVVTIAAIAGVVWGVGQLSYGEEINGWIDKNFGYR